MQELLEKFLELYTTKEETRYRLPVDADVDEFWKSELALRKTIMSELPLKAYDGVNYSFVKTKEYVASANAIAAMACNTSDLSVFSDLQYDGVMDEAFYSSVIEGAFSSKKDARKLIESGDAPKDKSERMILNNFNALKFVLEHLEYPITKEIILKINEILVAGTIEEDVRSEYRDGPVYVISHTGETVYTAPDARHVESMMDSLIRYVNDKNVHPIERAVLSHVYFVTVHPFFDGNGRTARALTYMVLLKAGYDFFRYVPISGILSEERAKYYKVLKASQDFENGYDFTYFVDYYTNLLARTLEDVKKKLELMEKYRKLSIELPTTGSERLLKGALWLVNNSISTITSDKWKNKFKVSFETARNDLAELENRGFLKRRVEGRKVYFDL